MRTLKGGSSHATSDTLSQFGTARDYHEFDMQNDLNWYREKDEDYPTPSCFENSDPFGGPSEDKFVTTLEKENQNENREIVFDPVFDPLEKTNRLDKVWPTTLCSSLKGIVLNDLVEDSKRTHDLQKQICEKNVDFDLNRDYDADKVEELDAVATNDESLMNLKEDEYEVFDLKIIHRKNRLVDLFVC